MSLAGVPTRADLEMQQALMQVEASFRNLTDDASVSTRRRRSVSAAPSPPPLPTEPPASGRERSSERVKHSREDNVRRKPHGSMMCLCFRYTDDYMVPSPVPQEAPSEVL